jgi:hypothetical protein
VREIAGLSDWAIQFVTYESSLSLDECLPDQAMELDKKIQATEIKIADLEEELKETEDGPKWISLNDRLTSLQNLLVAQVQQLQGGNVGRLFSSLMLV